MRFIVTLTIWAAPLCAVALEYPHVAAEPQKTGWPLTVEERAFVVNKPEHDRRPGREQNRHLPELWPRVPTAGNFGGDSWLKLHEAHVKLVQSNRGPVDVLLVGDSITIQWADSWKRHFPDLKTVNIGIGGDKTQNVLWRLDHGSGSRNEPCVRAASAKAVSQRAALMRSLIRTESPSRTADGGRGGQGASVLQGVGIGWRCVQSVACPASSSHRSTTSSSSPGAWRWVNRS